MVEIALNKDQVNDVVQKIKDGSFSEAAYIITDKPSTTDVIREAIEDALKDLRNPTAAQIENISLIYNKHGENLAQLKSSLAEFISPSSVEVQTTRIDEKAPIKDLKQLNDDQLEMKIGRIRSKQQENITHNKSPDAALANELSRMLHEQQLRATPQVGKDIVLKDQGLEEKKDISAQARANWFVLPDRVDLERTSDVKVVVGSPSIEALTERYAKQNLKATDDVKIYSSAMINSITDPREKFIAETESRRQHEFAEQYKNSSDMTDQDIFVHNVAAKFSIDKYPTVEPVVDKDDESIKHYFFTAGRIDIKYNFENKTHEINVEGSIPGRVAIALKRRTKSGRIIEGAYDIAEVQDGKPVFYCGSSQGEPAIADISKIINQTQKATLSLEIPEPAKMRKASPEQLAIEETSPDQQLSKTIEQTIDQEQKAAEQLPQDTLLGRRVKALQDALTTTSTTKQEVKPSASPKVERVKNRTRSSSSKSRAPKKAKSR